MRQLFARGADLERKDKTGETALDRALEEKCQNLVLLRIKGCGTIGHGQSLGRGCRNHARRGRPSH